MMKQRPLFTPSPARANNVLSRVQHHRVWERAGVRVFFLLFLLTTITACDREEGRSRPIARKPVEISATPTASDTTTSTAATPAGKGIIRGKVIFAGAKPTPSEINMSAVPECHKQHSTPVMEESIVVSDKNELANVVVYIKEGANIGAPAPNTPAVLDQQGCMYHPHVLAMMAGQTFQVKNSDPFLHNVHGLAKDNGEFNFPQPNKGDVKKVEANKSVENYKVKCDVHPWMGAFIIVLDNPFFASTQADGAFEIKGLPPGEYTLTTWHEKAKGMEQKVTVADDKPADVTLTLK